MIQRRMLTDRRCGGRRDLPPAAEAPAAGATPLEWTGAYIGAAVGGAWTNDRVEVDPGSPPLDLIHLNGSGVVGGAFAGYNWRTSSGVVIGAEADIEGASTSAGTDKFTTWDPFAGVPLGSVVTGEARTRETIPWQASLRARLGYAMGDMLIYATGGVAFAQADTKYSSIGFVSRGDAFTRSVTGWTLGGGLAYAFNAHWSARAEYRYTAFGRFTEPLRYSPLGSNCCNPAQHSPDENAVRFGVAYRFGAL